MPRLARTLFLFALLTSLVSLPLLALGAPDDSAAAPDATTSPRPANTGKEKPLAPKPKKKAPAKKKEKPLVPKTAAKKAADLPGNREIYVPFKNLKDVFEKEGQGVFVPYDEFMKLWKANLDRRRIPEKPPVPFVITRAEYDGKVVGELAEVTAKVDFETFTEGWSAVPLGFGEVAMGDARIGGKEATLRTDRKGYSVIVEGKGRYELSLTFVTPVRRSGDQETVAFRVPPTPVSRLVFDIPQEGARVTVDPNLATTRTGKGHTHVMAYVGAAASLRLSWLPRPVTEKAGPALVFADVTVSASVEDASLRTNAVFSYQIFRSPISKVSVAIPAANRVLFVKGDEIRTWDVKDSVLTVSLRKPAEENYRLTVTLTRDRPKSGEVAVPEVRALGVAREQGFVVVRAPGTVKVVPAASGLYRTGFDTVPPEIRSPGLVLAFRYPSHPWSLSLDVSRILPVVDVTGRTQVTIDERSLTSVDVFTLNVTHAPIFEFRIGLPEGVAVTDVGRKGVADYRIEGQGKDRILVVELTGSRSGTFPISVTTRRALTLLKGPLALSLPLLKPLLVHRLTGIVGIARDEALKLDTTDVSGLVPVTAREFGKGVTLAYRYAGIARKATLSISRRPPEVTARVDTTLEAKENRVAVVSHVTYDVKHSGVDTFSFTLPAALKDKFEVTGNNIREKPVEDAGKGRIRQKIVLQGKVTGESRFRVEYDLPYRGLATGASTTIPIPSLTPKNVKRDEGTYAIYREPTLEVTATTDHLEPIDPRELPKEIHKAEVFLAFKYLVRPHSLSLKIVKHEFLGVLPALVTHMQLVTILNEEGTARTEVVLALKVNGLQFLSIETEAKPDTLDVFTRGANGALVRRKETPQAGKNGATLVRMPAKVGPDDVIWVKLLYSVKPGLRGSMFHDFTFRAPRIEDKTVPVLGTTWYVYPPATRTITQAGGTLTWYDRPDSWLRNLVYSSDTLTAPRSGQKEIPADISDLAPRDQSPLVFGGRVENPEVTLTFASPGGFGTLVALVFLLVLAVGLFGFLRASGRARSLYVFGAIALPLLLAPIAAPGTASILSAVLFGGVVAGLVLLAGSVITLIRGSGRKAAAKEEE